MTTEYLIGCRVKIDRAKKHFAELEAHVRAFEKREPYIVFTYSDLKTRDELHKLFIVENIPAAWGGMIGDVVHNLRSALDLLAHDLVRLNGGTPGDHTKFPISSKPEFSRNNIRSFLNGASDEVMDLIEFSQPHAGGDGPFWQLHQLDILDKHILLIPVAGVHHQITRTISPRRSDGSLEPPEAPQILRKEALLPKDGTILLRRTWGALLSDNHHHHFNFSFRVAFGEGQIFDREAVVPTLKQLIDFVDSFLGTLARNIFKCAW